MGYFPSNVDFVRCLHWLGRWKIWSLKFFSWENKESWSLQSSGRVIPMQHSNKRSLSSISTFIKSLKHKNPTKLHKLKSIMAQVAKFSQLETATVTIFTQKNFQIEKSTLDYTMIVQLFVMVAASECIPQSREEKSFFDL